MWPEARAGAEQVCMLLGFMLSLAAACRPRAAAVVTGRSAWCLCCAVLAACYRIEEQNAHVACNVVSYSMHCGMPCCAQPFEDMLSCRLHCKQAAAPRLGTGARMAMDTSSLVATTAGLQLHSPDSHRQRCTGLARPNRPRRAKPLASAARTPAPDLGSAHQPRRDPWFQ